LEWSPYWSSILSHQLNNPTIKLMANDKKIAVDWPARITHAAFFLALTLVAARCTILEGYREPFDVSPGTSPYPSGPGAGTKLALDLLCCLPAILILLRRAIEPAYRLRWNKVFIPIAELTTWMLLSIAWSDDKFAALMGGADFLAAMAILWATTQLVRSWRRLRVVAALAFGLLLVYIVGGFYYKFVELPDLVRTFEQNKTQILTERGLTPGSFAANQFEHKIVDQEVLGYFNTSENSLAAMIVLLATIAAGAGIQRLVNRDDPAWAVAVVAAVVAAGLLLIYTHCKAAIVTPILAALFFIAIWKYRKILAAESQRIYWLSVGGICLAIFAVLGHGLVHHSLPSSSLNFRWRYWVASCRMFRQHPLIGVGWENFPAHYLADRLPAASEEIRDPHNFLVRFLVELGIVGGILAVAWMLRLWWGLTRPITPPPPMPAAKKTAQPRIGLFLALSAAIILVNTLASLDFSQSPSFLIVELMKRMLFFCALAMGMLAIGLRSLSQPELDDRPAPWILYGILISLGVFLIHNLIEFSLFEPGPLCLFSLLAGAALGARQTNAPVNLAATKKNRAAIFWAATGAAAALWLAGFFGIWLPVARAESSAQIGDDALRAGKYSDASLHYESAFDRVPINADYAFRAARALHIGAAATASPDKSQPLPRELQLQILSLYSRAIQHDPSNVTMHLARASFAMLIHDDSQALADYQKAVELNPNDVSIHRDYAGALQSLGKNTGAAEQLQAALDADDQLDAAEPKRLPPDQRKTIEQQITQLKQSPDIGP
jgi:tetratricopeptide (TPR) repeat protein